MENKKVIYIAGPISGVPNYWAKFEQAEDILKDLGYIPLSPAHLPAGMSNDKYMRIDFAMIDSADVVVFLPGYEKSEGAMLEFKHCMYTNKPVAFMFSIIDEDHRDEELASLKNYLKKVLGE